MTEPTLTTSAPEGAPVTSATPTIPAAPAETSPAPPTQRDLASEPVAPAVATPEPEVPESQPAPATQQPDLNTQRLAQRQAMEQAWYKQQMAVQQQQIQQMKQQNNSYQTENMSDEEYAAWEQQQHGDQLANREAHLQAQLFNQQYGQYISQFAPPEVLAAGQGQPEHMAHAALVHLHTDNVRLKQENEALKLAAQATPPVPTTTQQPGTAAPGAPSVWDLSYDEIEKMKNAALTGLSTPDYPSIS